MKTFVFFLTVYFIGVTASRAQDDHVITQQRIEWGPPSDELFVDTIVEAFVEVLDDTTRNRRLMFFEDLKLSLNQGIDSTHFLVNVELNGVPFDEFYTVTQKLYRYEDIKIPTAVCLVLDQFMVVTGVYFFEAAHMKEQRYRVVNVVVDVAMR